jgi:hypothetical protein
VDRIDIATKSPYGNVLLSFCLFRYSEAVAGLGNHRSHAPVVDSEAVALWSHAPAVDNEAVAVVTVINLGHTRQLYAAKR